jgi:membrane protease YdiL (CAAX protease family)
MTFRRVFKNNAGRLRSGWRALIFLLAFGTAGLIVGSVIGSLLFLVDGDLPVAIFLTVNGIVSLVLAIGIGWACGNLLEGLPFKALGASFTARWLSHLGLGIAIGSLTLAIAVLLAGAFGGLSFVLSEADPAAISRSLAVSLLVFGAAAAFEEALFRGYVLQTFARARLAWLAIGLTSAFFAALHLRNPDAGLFSTANTALAGVWFGLAYMRSRDLWFPFGLHLAWNWLQGSVFGIEVSGLTTIVSAPVLRENDRGPAWLTGANYGVEGGLVTTIALIISMVAIWFMPFLKPSEEMLALTDPPRSEAR